jgi:PKD repeat protein
VTCDGVPLNAYVGTNSNYDVNCIYFDVSHLSAAQHTITVVITTNPLIPKASFTSQIVPTPNQPGVTVQFTDTTLQNHTSWLWNFGDGNTSTAQNPTHVYATEGSYTVTLDVAGVGGSNSTTQNLSAILVPPRNYSQYVTRVFKPNMTSWDFMENIATVYTDTATPGIFWLLIWILRRSL